MTFDKFTIRAQEAVQDAVQTAQQAGQQTIEPVHLLKGVLDKGKDITNYVFQKLGVNGQIIELQRVRSSICRASRAASLICRQTATTCFRTLLTSARRWVMSL